MDARREMNEDSGPLLAESRPSLSPAEAAVNNLEALVRDIGDDYVVLQRATAGFGLFHRLHYQTVTAKEAGAIPVRYMVGRPMVRCGAALGPSTVEVVTDFQGLTSEQIAVVSTVFRDYHLGDLVNRVRGIADNAKALLAMFEVGE